MLFGDIIKSLFSHFIPASIPGDVESQRKARLAVAVLLIIAYFNVSYTVISLLIDYPGGLYSQIPLFFITIFTLFSYKKYGPTDLLFGFYFLSCTVCIAISIYFSGGFLSVLYPWLASTPIVAVMVWNKRASLISLSAVLLFSGIFFLLYQQDYPFPQQIDESISKWFYLSTSIGLVLILYLISIVFENAKNSALNTLEKKNDELAEEKQKTENLLLNILPAEIADELKEKGHSKARLFNETTIIFIDFVGFTQIAEQLSPQKLVSEIHYCFTHFDKLVAQHGLEKIKTVGDAYIVASGLPINNKQHARHAIELALAIKTFMEHYAHCRATAHKPYFRCRIGINSGSVVAGIVGTQKFAYDIWGDAVNLAARMEQHSETGKINVSQSTYEQTRHDFDFTYRGQIQAKHKGATRMYFVETASALTPKISTAS